MLITILCSASTHKTFKLSKFCQFRSPVCDLSSLRRRCPSSGIPECPLCPTSRSGKDHWRRAENGWDDTVIQQKQSKSSKLHWIESWSNKNHLDLAEYLICSGVSLQHSIHKMCSITKCYLPGHIIKLNTNSTMKTLQYHISVIKIYLISVNITGDTNFQIIGHLNESPKSPETELE